MVGFARWIALISAALAVFSANAAPITAFTTRVRRRAGSATAKP